VAGRRKLAGSAQWRHRGTLLQHGSVLLHDNQAVADGLGQSRKADRKADRAASVGRRVEDTRTRKRQIKTLRTGFEEEFEAAVRDGALTDDEERAAGALRERFEDPEWTWRR
jgi:lipoate-protein ligase A